MLGSKYCQSLSLNAVLFSVLNIPYYLSLDVLLLWHCFSSLLCVGLCGECDYAAVLYNQTNLDDHMLISPRTNEVDLGPNPIPLLKQLYLKGLHCVLLGGELGGYGEVREHIPLTSPYASHLPVGTSQNPF